MALLAAAPVACGGGDPGPGPREVVRQYLTAFADGKVDRACGFLAPAARADFARYARAVGFPRLGRCEDVLRLADRELPGRARTVLRRARVTSLEVHGDRAVARVSEAPRPFPLVRRGGGWKIAHLDFRYQTFRVRAGQICTRYAGTVKALPRPALTRTGLLRYLAGLRAALEVNRREIAALGRPPERVRARDELLAGLADQERIVAEEIGRLRAGAPLSSVRDFQRRELRAGQAVNAAQATLRIRCGEARQ